MKKIYFGLALIILSTSLIACKTNTNDSFSLSVADFEKGILKENIQILDVRSMEEFQSGHIKNALLADWTNTNEFNDRTQSLDKSKPIYAYCFSGARSSQAAESLKEKGFTVYNLAGGIASWQREGKPLEGINAVKQISVTEYQSLIPANKIVLVDVSATWCPPCKKMEPIIETLQKTNGTKFSLVKIDGGEQSSITQSLGITVFPTFIIYKNGKIFWKKEGIVSLEELTKQLQ